MADAANYGKEIMETKLSSQFTAQSRRRKLIGAAVIAVLIGAMALDTKVVVVGSQEDAREQAFSPDSYGVKEFPRIQQHILDNAVDAQVLIKAVLEDKKAAGETSGVSAGIGAVIPVSFAGTVGEGKGGIYAVELPNWPEKYKVRVQTGPAINGTDIRDATGDIAFGQFKNQIEYQDVGSALNRAMKAKVLDAADTSELGGKQIAVTGVFKLINAKNWLVTPVRFEVK